MGMETNEKPDKTVSRDVLSKVDSILKIAGLELSALRFKEAEELCDQALALYPESDDAWMRKGFAICQGSLLSEARPEENVDCWIKAYTYATNKALVEPLQKDILHVFTKFSKFQIGKCLMAFTQDPSQENAEALVHLMRRILFSAARYKEALSTECLDEDEFLSACAAGIRVAVTREYGQEEET